MFSLQLKNLKKMLNKQNKKGIFSLFRRQKNRKGQMGEQLEDIVSFLVVGLGIIILFLWVLVFYKHGAETRTDLIYGRVINDKFSIAVNSLMREHTNEEKTFSDLFREENETVTNTVAKELRNCDFNNLCAGSASSRANDVFIYHNSVEECKKLRESIAEGHTIDLSSRSMCFFVPGKEALAIKSVIRRCSSPIVTEEFPSGGGQGSGGGTSGAG